MPDNNREKTGRWIPGESGNPAGRPRGSRNRGTELARDLLDSDDAGEIVKKAIELAKAGDPVALRLCVERIVPRRGSVATLQLDHLQFSRAVDVADAASVVLHAAAAGELTLPEARQWMELLDRQREAIETADLAVRVELMEDRLAVEAERRKRRRP